MNIKLKIFNNNINNKYKLIPFNVKKNDYRDKYEAPVSKEWKNTIYSYYKNSMKNISINHLNLNKLVKSYFDFFFINKFIHFKNMSTRRRYSLLRRIHVSNIEIKQTNNKAIITLYIINTEKNRLFSRYIENLPSGIYKIISKSNMKYDFNKNKYIRSQYHKVVVNIEEFYKRIFKNYIIKNSHLDIFWSSFKDNYYLNNENYRLFESKIRFNKVENLCLKNMENSPLVIYKWFYLSYQTIFFFEKEISKYYNCSKKDSNLGIPGFFEQKSKEIEINIKILKKTINDISIISKINIGVIMNTLTSGSSSAIKYLCLKQVINIKKLFQNFDLTIRRHTYAYEFYYLKLNKTYIYLFKLNSFFNRILRKTIEFNIISLKSLVFSTDIFTKALSLKLRKRKFFPVIKGMNSIINRAKFPVINTIMERASLKGYKDLNIVQNRFKDTYLFSSFVNGADNLLLNYFLNEIQTKKVNSLEETVLKSIFNSIKHKNMGGIRLEVKGRLTRRYRADRAVYKLKWKGGLKNIESSFNKLSSVLYRGHFKSNVNYSISSSKRRVGSFAVKGWMSGK